MTAPARLPPEGIGVRLRPVGAEDLLRIHDWYNDPELVAPFDRFTTETFEEFRESIETAAQDSRSLAPRFAVERIADHALVGVVGYYEPHPVLETTEVWYLIGDTTARGQGFGREAVASLVAYVFQVRSHERVGASSDVANGASSRLLESLGFRLEGTLRQALFHHSGWHDVLVYGVTRSEWDERGRKKSSTRGPPPPAGASR
ncbi:MAG: GNAT family N-acetyltransferase [Thermoplasmata archaeon]|nr:GNAT family N-acetyltransferase [Thermoplasmata archaeon]